MLKLSKNLRTISNGRKILYYNALLGGAVIAATELETMLKGVVTGKIKNDNHYENSSTILAKLKQLKLLVDCNDPERKRPTSKYSNNFITSGGVCNKLRLNVTRTCNMRCQYCYINSIASNVAPKKMTWDVAKKALDKFFSLLRKHQNRLAIVRFFGGEPLLNWTVIKKSIEYATNIASGINIQFIINTNGTIFSKEIASVLNKYQVAMAISLDGDGYSHDRFRKFISGHGTFQIIYQNIINYLKQNCVLGIETTVGDHNIIELTKLMEKISKLNRIYNTNVPVSLQNLNFDNEGKSDTNTVDHKVKHLMAALNTARDLGVSAENGMIHYPFMSLMNEREKGIFCRAMGGEVSVETNGDLFPCAALPLKYGHLNRFNAIFDTELYRQLVKRVAGNIDSCRGCDIEVFCGGGCAADAYWVNKDTNLPTNECEFKKHFFKEMVIRFLNDEEGRESENAC